MKRKTIINNLKELPDLWDLARSFFTDEISQYVPLGLLTEDEYQEYLSGLEAEGRLYWSIQKAEDAVPRPNFETSPRYPQAYLDLVARAQELKPLVEGDKRVRDSLMRLMSPGFYPGKGVGDLLAIQPLAKAVQDVIKAAEDDYNSEYDCVNKAIEQKTRIGTIALRVHHEINVEWETARKEARSNAEAGFIAKYGGVIERKWELERLFEKRRTEKLQPIREAMVKLIRQALPKGDIE